MPMFPCASAPLWPQGIAKAKWIRGRRATFYNSEKAMSSRITKDARDQIIDKMVARATKDQREKLKADEKKLGDSIYERLIPPASQAHINALSDEFFQRDDDIRLNYRGNWFEVALSGVRSLPPRHARFEATADEYKKYNELSQRKKDLCNEVNKLEHQIAGVFAAANTWKKLLAAWPEAKEFIIPYMETPMDSLPAMIPQELNKVLKLPPKKTEKV